MTIKDLLKYNIKIGDFAECVVYRFSSRNKYYNKYYLERNTLLSFIKRDGLYSSYVNINNTTFNYKTHLERNL